MTSLPGVIWGVGFIESNHLILSLRDGELYSYKMKVQTKKKLNPPNVIAKGQGGLMDVLYKSPYIYMTYTKKSSGELTTALARAEFNLKKPLVWQDLFVAKVQGGSNVHFGSRVVFHKNSLFMTIGDRGKRDLAQSLEHHNGKILRLTLEGKPHPENPFLNQKKALPEIWSYGHRNPQGLAVNKLNGKLYSSEFGPKGGDELNLIERGKNYGWPVITYGREYWGPKIGTTQKKGMQQPLLHWTPSISPSGLHHYSGANYKSLNDSFLLACLSDQHIRQVQPTKKGTFVQTEHFKKMNERIRHIKESPDGWLYFTTDSGKLFKIIN